MHDISKEMSRLIKHFDDILKFVPGHERSGLTETPHRAAASFAWSIQGYAQTPEDVLKVFEDGAEECDEMVVQAGIPMFSLCEHHLLPFFGVVHIGYIPKGKIVGLSKFTRLVEVFSRRLQVQERLTSQIATALQDHLQPVGVGVAIRARHLCMESRGVQKIGTVTYTSHLTGWFKEKPTVRSEWLRFVDLADRRTTNI